MRIENLEHNQIIQELEDEELFEKKLMCCGAAIGYNIRCIIAVMVLSKGLVNRPCSRLISIYIIVVIVKL